jgi:hypothetical protein
LVNAFRVDNKLQIENAIKNNLFFNERMRSITLKNKKYVELLSIDNVTFADLDKVIKEIITSIEYSPENYIKILQENKELKQQLENKNNSNNINELILLTTENKHLKIQNIKLMKKLDSIKNNAKYKEIQFIDTSIQEDEIDNYSTTINTLKQNYYNTDLKRNKEGKYCNGDIVYDKLIGSREDVWNNKAYKTTGGLNKNDLMLNSNGKIVSKKKSATEACVDRFKLHGVNKTS